MCVETGKNTFYLMYLQVSGSRQVIDDDNDDDV